MQEIGTRLLCRTYLLVKAGYAGNWNSIVKVEKELWDQNIDVKCLFKGVLGNGLNIRFWVDFWVGDRPLMYMFQALFVLEADKNVSVAQRLLAWDWKRLPLSANENVELQSCVNLLLGINTSSLEDKWIWAESGDGTFSTAACRSLLTRFDVPYYPFEWVKGVPRKVSIHAWRAIQDRLPTLVGLNKRKILQGSTTCRLCGEGDENADHLFTSCTFAAVLWNKMSAWLGVQPIYAFCVKDLLELHSGMRTTNEKRKLIRIIILGACWSLWRARNDVIFNGRRVNVSCVFGEVQASTFTWVKHKLKLATWTWENWKAFNVPNV